MSDPYAYPTSPPPESGETAQSWPPPPGYLPPEEQRTNGFAIASLVFGIISGILLAVIFGIIALVQIPKKNQKGKGMAIAGLVLAGVWTLIWVALIVVVVMTSADRDAATGEITEGGDVSTLSLEVGDCVNDLEESEAVASLPAVPCDQPHEGEVFALFDLPEGDYPNEAELIDQAETGCVDRLMVYAPEAAQDPALGLFYFYPLESSWPADRQVVCIAAAAETTTGSIAE
ncbi:MAG: DUF4190 domain-containing protein [Jiangellaceae bacterium]